jgi:hypothetical protein
LSESEVIKANKKEKTMAEAVTSNEKIHEALELLNQAAKEKGAELRQMLVGKYDGVKDIIAGAVERPAGWVVEKTQAAGRAAVNAEVEVVEHVKQAAATVDESAHHNPWPWIGGAAFVGLLVGLLICPRR